MSVNNIDASFLLKFYENFTKGFVNARNLVTEAMRYKSAFGGNNSQDVNYGIADNRL